MTPTQLAKLVMIEIARPSLYRALADHAKKREAFVTWLKIGMLVEGKDEQSVLPFAHDDREWLLAHWPKIHFETLVSSETEKQTLDERSLEWLLQLGSTSVVGADEPSKPSPM